MEPASGRVPNALLAELAAARRRRRPNPLRDLTNGAGLARRNRVGGSAGDKKPGPEPPRRLGTAATTRTKHARAPEGPVAGGGSKRAKRAAPRVINLVSSSDDSGDDDDDGHGVASRRNAGGGGVSTLSLVVLNTFMTRGTINQAMQGDGVGDLEAVYYADSTASPAVVTRKPGTRTSDSTSALFGIVAAAVVSPRPEPQPPSVVAEAERVRAKLVKQLKLAGQHCECSSTATRSGHVWEVDIMAGCGAEPSADMASMLGLKPSCGGCRLLIDNPARSIRGRGTWVKRTDPDNQNSDLAYVTTCHVDSSSLRANLTCGFLAKQATYVAGVAKSREGQCPCSPCTLARTG